MSRRGQRGQALTEFLVVATALIPLFLLVPVIAKYQDIAHATQMASRYAAFDSLVRNNSQNTEKPLSQLQDEVRRRFFSNAGAPVKTQDVAGDFKAHQNLFWRTPDDRALISRFADITVSRSGQSAHDGQPAAVVAGPFSFSYGSTGISSARVEVRVANFPEGWKFYQPLDHLDLTIQRSTSVLADAWTGKNPDEVQTRFVPQLPPASGLSTLSQFIQPTMALVEPGVSPPRLGQLDFWRDTVPADRLVGP